MSAVRLCLGLGLVGLALVGCGDLGATEPELRQDATRGDRIGDFDEGRGYVARCADGALSHSGGVQGACSYHGGVGEQSSYEPEPGGYEPEVGDEAPAIDPTLLKKNGQPSYEFEPDDIERAEEAPPSVREYCAGAVSEAQEVGCLSHVEPSEVP